MKWPFYAKISLLYCGIIYRIWGTWGVSETAPQGVMTLPLNIQSQIQLALADNTQQGPQARVMGKPMAAGWQMRMRVPYTFVSNSLVPPLAGRGTS